MNHYSIHRPWQRQQRCSFSGWRPHVLLLALTLSVVGASLLGCSSDTTGPAPLSAGQAYWALWLNYHAVNMATIAPDDTVRLIATPRNVAGAPLVGLDRPTFQAGDSSVAVDSAGLVTAHFITSGQPTFVIASLTAQGVTLADTVLIQVTDTIPQYPLATFSIHPVPGDSAKRALDYFQNGHLWFVWPAIATDAEQNVVCNSTMCPLQISYTSSNPQAAAIDSIGRVFANDTGHVVFTASTWAYGRTFRDSVAFIIGYRLKLQMSIADAASGIATFQGPRSVILGVGATVTFVCAPPSLGFPCTVPVNVVFDDSAVVDTATDNLLGAPPTGAGNIPTFGADAVNAHNDVRARRFPLAGTYRYHSSVLSSETDTLIIKEQQ